MDKKKPFPTATSGAIPIARYQKPSPTGSSFSAMMAWNDDTGFRNYEIFLELYNKIIF
jgi:hypothetical protein